MALKGKPLLLTTSDQDVYVCPATQEASVHALVFSNLTAGAITVSIKRYIAATATTQELVAALSVAANGTVNWPKPMNLAVGDKIIASASANSSIVCDYGAYENSATPAAVGFTGKGAWSSSTTYVANDVVTVSGSSYLAIQGSTNQNPTSATAYWMLLASKGDTGSGDVTGPASSTNNAVVVFDGATGKLIKQGAAGTDYVAPGGALGTPSSGTLSNCTVDGTDSVGFRNAPVNSQSAAYTLVLADAGKVILHPSTDANARTFTIPANASVAYAVGTVLTFVNMTSQVVTIAITSDTLYLAGTGTTGSRSLAQYGMATAVKLTSTTWLINGSGLT